MIHPDSTPPTADDGTDSQLLCTPWFLSHDWRSSTAALGESMGERLVCARCGACQRRPFDPFTP